MSKSAVMTAAKRFFRERGINSFVEGMDGLHFNSRIGFVSRERECWFNFDGRHVLFSVIVGSSLPDEETHALHLALQVGSSISGFFGMPNLGPERVSIDFVRPFSPATELVSGFLDATLEYAAPRDLDRMDVMYPKAAEGYSPREIVELEQTFGYPAGHA